MSRNSISLVLATLFSLLCFAGNSVFCRLAIGEQVIDPISFTSIRILSGMLTLLLLLKLKHAFQNQNKNNKGNTPTNTSKSTWSAGISLFVYAILFSYAYQELTTGTGALILFGAIQMTMVAANKYLGNKIRKGEIIGVFVAFCGFIFLMLPNAQAPSFLAFSLMFIAGISTAIYTLCGRSSEDSLTNATYSFVKAMPFVIILLIFTLDQLALTLQGTLLAVASGAITSGVGYYVWYTAVPKLTVMQASVIPLSVPVIAAIAGSLFNNEPITMRLSIATLIIISGIFIVISSKQKVVN